MESKYSEQTLLYWKEIQRLKKTLGYDVDGSVPEQGELLMEIIKRIQLLPNQFFYINYTPKSHIIYVSPEVKENLGYDLEEFDYRRLLDIIHPDDQPIVLAGTNYYYPLGNFRVFKPFEFAVFFNYRVSRKNGIQKRVLRSSSPLLYDDSGKMIYHISVITDITEMQPSNRVHIWHSGLLGHIPTFPIESFYNNSVLSKREMDILFYLYEGLKSDQIADKLYISKHTVDTHRRKMLAKMNVENTGQLIRKSIKLQLIPQAPATSNF